MLAQQVRHGLTSLALYCLSMPEQVTCTETVIHAEFVLFMMQTCFEVPSSLRMMMLGLCYWLSTLEPVEICYAIVLVWSCT